MSDAQGFTSVEKGLEDQITCPVCHEHFKEPKVLPCCHYYCKECIQALASRTPSGDPDPRGFPCPECRNETLLPNNDADQLPTAFFVNRMKELHAKMMTFDGRPPGETGRSVVRCTVHDKKLKIFCLDCRKVICRDCIVVDHAGHSCDFVNKVSTDVKRAVSERLSDLKDVQRNISSAIEEVKVTRDSIIALKEATSEQVEEKFCELQKVLTEHKKKLLEDTDQIAQQKLKRLSTQEADLVEISANVESVVDSILHSVESSTDVELLSIHEQILGQINQAISKHSDGGDLQLEPVEEADIRLDMPITAKSFQVDLQSNAQIKHTSADPTKCVVEFGTGTEHELTVTLKPYLPNSKPTKVSQSVEVYIKSKVDGLVYPVTPDKMPDNSYKVIVVPHVRGRHKVTVVINGAEVEGSPFPVLVTIPPTRLGRPVRVIKGVKKPWGIAINSKGELVVTEHSGNVVFLDRYDSKIREIKRADHFFEFLAGVAVDGEDNVYVADYNRNTLFKFNNRGQLLKTIDRKGRGAGEFNKPRGLTIAKNHLYVCDYDNNRVQVFTLELDYVKQISPFHEVRDISVDEGGQLYICDTGNNRIQVFSNEEELLFTFNAKDKRDLIGPCGICVANDFVYVVENPMYKDENVSVFTKQGLFVTSFGRTGKDEGEFRNPYGITVDLDGFIYVCDYGNSRIQIF